MFLLNLEKMTHMTLNCFSCNKKITAFDARGSKKQVEDKGFQIPNGMSDDDKLCQGCLDKIREAQVGGFVSTLEEVEHSKNGINRPTRWWYLVPIFLGILGGLIMYLIVKDDDKKMAKNGLILSIVLTVIGLIIYIPLMILSAFMGMY